MVAEVDYGVCVAAEELVPPIFLGSAERDPASARVH